MNLRPYQVAAIEAIQTSFRDKRRAPLYVCATGSGKTVVLSEIAHRLQAKGTRACILVHRQELVDQTAAALGRAGVTFGLVSPHYAPRDHHTIQVASIQTLTRRFHRHAPFEFLLIDEAHHATAGQWAKVRAQYPTARMLGVTATPCRLDGVALGDVFDDMIEGPTIAELIADGYLTPAKVYAPPSHIDFAALRLKAKDFDPTDMEGAVSSATMLGDAVAHYRKYADGQPAIAFCISVRHAQDVATAFNEAGYRAIAVNGDDTHEHRRRAIAGLTTGQYQVLTSCSIISEGTDIPRATCAILLRPTMSLSLLLQMVGRVLRPVYEPGHAIDTAEQRLAAIAAGEKPRAIILDRCGNIARHGLPGDDREWSLTEDQPRASKSGDLRDDAGPCQQCYVVIPKSDICPECGYMFPQLAPPPRTVTTIEGELIEITEAPEKKGEALNYQRLKDIAAARGYKPGWAYHVGKLRRRHRYFKPIEIELSRYMSHAELMKYLTGQAPERAA